jgi:hypothetical protein
VGLYKFNSIYRYSSDSLKAPGSSYKVKKPLKFCFQMQLAPLHVGGFAVFVALSAVPLSSLEDWTRDAIRLRAARREATTVENSNRRTQ